MSKKIFFAEMPYDGLNPGYILGRLNNLAAQLQKSITAYVPDAALAFPHTMEVKNIMKSVPKFWNNGSREELAGVHYYLIFNKDLTDQQVLFWMGVVAGWHSRNQYEN